MRKVGEMGNSRDFALPHGMLAADGRWLQAWHDTRHPPHTRIAVRRLQGPTALGVMSTGHRFESITTRALPSSWQKYYIAFVCGATTVLLRGRCMT